MITLYFIRHGETTWNSTGRYQGATDVPLSEKGKRQAAETAAYFRDIHLDGVFSSDLCRAAETAKDIAVGHHLSLVQDARLKEIGFGEWEGLTYDEIEARWPGGIEEMYLHPAELKIAGGESFGEVQARAMSFIKELIAAAGEEDKTYAVVSHGGTLRTIFCGILGFKLDDAWTFCQSNANISCIKYYGKRNLLFLLNSTAHLSD